VLDISAPHDAPPRAFGGGGSGSFDSSSKAQGWGSWSPLQKGCAVGWLLFFWILVFAILGLSAQTRSIVGGLRNYNAAEVKQKAPPAALGLPPPLASLSWPELLAVARGSTVVFASWSDTLAGIKPHPIDDYLSGVLAPWLLSQFQVTLKHLRLNGTVEAVNMVVAANATGS
jgi:hypothetical protein